MNAHTPPAQARAGRPFPWRAASPFLRVQLVGWALFALVDLVSRQLAYFNLPIALALTAIVYPTMIGLSAGLGWLYDRYVPATRLRPAALLAMVLLSAAAAAVVVAVLAVARAAFGWRVPNWPPLEEVALPFLHYAICLFGWSLLYVWIAAEAQRRRALDAAIAAQAEALRAEIQQLRLQINPHFLFNALNGIAEEVPEHPAAALAMLRDLTDYLRHVLAGIRAQVVTVTEEVAALSAYLRIQQARFGARLHTRLDLADAAAGLPIPNSLLQPLVENAMEHGDRAQMLELVLLVRLEGERLVITVANTGTLAPGRRARASHGIGLENLRRRLGVHYPGRHAFRLEEVAGEVVATLVLEGAPCSAS